MSRAPISPTVLLLTSACVGLLLSCGDNAKPSSPNRELLPDTTIEQGCTSEPPAAGAVRAKFLACDDEKVAGLLAAGRSGDVLLENNLVRFVVRGPGEGFRFHGTSGGALIDAALHGREDQMLEVLPLLDWATGNFQELVITSSGLAEGSEPGVAELVVRGELTTVPLFFSLFSVAPANLVLEQRYRLRPDTTHIEISTRAFSVDGESSDEITAVRDVLSVGGAVTLFIPGQGLSPAIGASGRVVASDGGESSYGMVYPEASLRMLALDGVVALQAVELIPDGAAETRLFIVGDGSTSSVTDSAFQLSGETVQSIDGTGPPGFTIAVNDMSGDPITRINVDSAGKFQAFLPSDSYRLQSVQVGTLPGPEVEVAVGEAPVEGIVIEAGAGGHLAIAVADEGGAAMPARVMLTSKIGVQQLHVGPGTTEIPLAVGTYAVSVSRGMEYSLFQQQVLTIADGEVQTLDVTLEREINTEGWIAVDSHLHSEMSPDSSVPLMQRLLSVAGEGVEVAISTDHDFVTDYQPYVAMLGLSSHLATQVGVEVSTSTVGHINGWPLEAKHDETAAGAPQWYGQAPNEIANRIRDGQDERLVQINHPRRSSSASFDSIDFDPITLTSRADPQALGITNGDLNDFNFDAIEVANAKAGESFNDAFVDWLAFAAAGQRKTATGNSDSHSATAYSGRSRTYVWVGEDQDVPADVDLAALNAAVRKGAAVVSQGAFVTITADDPVGQQSYGPGDIAPLQGQAQISLHVQVQAPSWLPVVKLEIYEQGQLVFSQALDALETQPMRFDQVIDLPLTLATDTFFLARVELAASAAPVLPSPGPSFTNPVLVDRDGDGLFAP